MKAFQLVDYGHILCGLRSWFYDNANAVYTISSLGTVRPHPWEHGTGFLGLCSHSLRWMERVSSLTTTEHPYSSLSHLGSWIMLLDHDLCYIYRISSRLSRFFSILGTGLSSAMDMDLLSTGQVCWRLSHWTIQSAQKACSHLNISQSLMMFLMRLMMILLRSQTGILEHRTTDGTYQLLVHRSLEPGYIVPHVIKRKR